MIASLSSTQAWIASALITFGWLIPVILLIFLCNKLDDIHRTMTTPSGRAKRDAREPNRGTEKSKYGRPPPPGAKGTMTLPVVPPADADLPTSGLGGLPPAEPQRVEIHLDQQARPVNIFIIDDEEEDSK